MICVPGNAFPLGIYVREHVYPGETHITVTPVPGIYIYFNKMKTEVGMLLPKSTDTRGVGISSMRKSIIISP